MSDNNKEKAKKDQLRREYITKHGRCCETCGNDPVNYGQRASCHYGPGEDAECNEEKGYPLYQEATSIYSIDITYCC